VSPARASSFPASTERTALPTFKYVEITGDPRERGRQYGEQARDEIAQSLDYYRQLTATLGGLSWLDLTARAAAWMPLIEKLSPDLLEEAAGVAEGAGITLADVLTLNARGEIVYDPTFSRASDRSQAAGPGECSSFALMPEASGDEHVYCGQNWDWRAATQDTVIVLRVVQPPKPTVITVVEAGQAGRHGVNSAGLALNANGLGGRFGNEIGVPQTFIRRAILDSASLKDALDVPFYQRQQIAANLLLTHRDGFAIDIESTPVRHNWLYPDAGLLVHTNHYRGPVPVPVEAEYRPYSTDTLYRVARLEQALRRCASAGSSKEADGLIQAGLTDHFGFPDSVCNHADQASPALLQDKTIMSQIADLTTGEVRLTVGNPCEHGFDPLPWNAFDGPSGASPPSRA
jgi:isopenicillin-N N-acyltransferase like protein